MTGDAGLDAALGGIEAGLGGGTLGLAARFLPTGETVLWRADATFPTASSIKIAIVHEVLAQGLDLTRPVEVTAGDRVGGSGVLSALSVPLTLPLGDLATLAISVSDNTASNLCLRAAGGPEAVNARLAGWGIAGTRIHRPIRFALGPDDPPHTATGTPADFLALLPRLHAGVWERMALVGDTAMLPRPLTVNPFADALGVPRPAFTVRHKPGAVTGVRNDVGRIESDGRALDVAVFTRGCPDPRWSVDNAGCLAVARAVETLVERFFPT